MLIFRAFSYFSSDFFCYFSSFFDIRLLLLIDSTIIPIDNTKIILEKAIKLGGTTIKSFTSSEGVHGLFQNELAVHGKKNANCPNCGNKIEVIKINGRSTYFCSKCQK